MALLVAAAALFTCGAHARAQATSRGCAADGASDDPPGPACLLKREPIGTLPAGDVYWHIATYPSLEAAQRDQPDRGTVVGAFGQVWLFTIGPRGMAAAHGQHVADVGPITVEADRDYAAEYLKSTFSPGMTAPLHVHSGPEAFYALSGDTCLETPDGAQLARGPGNTVVIRGGPPMLLMAIGTATRRGFALILHDSARAPTTLVHDWVPKGLCEAALRAPAGRP